MHRVIVTGGTGFIGKHLVNKLLNCGRYYITLVSNAHNSAHFALSSSYERSSLKPYFADIRDKTKISKIFQTERPDTCIHLAAKTSVSDSIRNPNETMDINVKGTENILEACHENNVRNFIFASSAAVYGDVAELPISEDQTLKPLSPYGSSKMLAERHISSYTQSGKIQNAISLRIFNVYGLGQSSESDVITKFAKGLSRGQPPVIHGDGKYTRDFISVDDVVNSFLSSLRLMETGEKINQSPSLVFNIGTGIPTSITDLAKKMIKIFGFETQPVYKGGNDEGVIRQSYANVTRAKEILHFVPKQDIDTGLKEMIEQMQSAK